MKELVKKNGQWKWIERKTRIINKTTIPTEVIRDVIRFTRPPGIKSFTVTVRPYRNYWKGRGSGCGITVWLNPDAKYPRRWQESYQIGQHRGRYFYLASFTECMIRLFAHELMHTRQGQKGPMRGRVWGARGRYSEIETQAWAIKKLREYRRGV
jgi:hypothetical protein